MRRIERQKSSDFDEILYTAAYFELDERYVIKNEKVALDRLRVRHNVFLVTFKFLTEFVVLLPRDAMHKRGLCRHAVSVRPSVCLSRSWIVSKRIKISSKFFQHR